ncbi:hypothetical protein DL96DRAFT_600938 [Flagelloscypha sp. PMI_526]|nr:hypothetical protein DL96DRAFT_600938 [Flagelloscypha sp. PMI_526]
MSNIVNIEDIRKFIIDAEMTDFAVVILLYDHILTFHFEIEYIWSQRWGKSSAIFFLNRYFGLAAHITSLTFNHVPHSDSKFCHSTVLAHQVFLVAAQIIVCLIISMRVYALYGCSKKIMWFLLIYVSLLLAIVCWSVSGQLTLDSGEEDTRTTTNCHKTMDIRSSKSLAISYGVLFAYDAAIFGLTLFKTCETRPRAMNTRSVSLVALLLRDGAIYFMLKALVNLGNILTVFLAPPFFRGCLGTFSSCLSITLVSRMMLNLHRAHSALGVFTTLTTPMFELSSQPSEELDTLVEVEVELDGATSRAEPGRIVLAVA